MWKNICGKERGVEVGSGRGERGGKNPVSRIVATYRPCTGKEREQETKTHIGFAWKSEALVRKKRRSRMLLQWFFIHQLIYGLFPALNKACAVCPHMYGPWGASKWYKANHPVCWRNLQHPKKVFHAPLAPSIHPPVDGPLSL